MDLVLSWHFEWSRVSLWFYNVKQCLQFHIHMTWNLMKLFLTKFRLQLLDLFTSRICSRTHGLCAWLQTEEKQPCLRWITVLLPAAMVQCIHKSYLVWRQHARTVLVAVPLHCEFSSYKARHSSWKVHRIGALVRCGLCVHLLKHTGEKSGTVPSSRFVSP